MPISIRQRYLLLMSETWPPAGVDEVLWYAGWTSTYAAPLTSPHTAALDGDSRSVGRSVLTQTDGQYSTSGGNLVIPAQSTPAWDDQGFIGQDDNGDGFARSPGLAYLWNLTSMNVTNTNGFLFRFSDGTFTYYGGFADDWAAIQYATNRTAAVNNGGATVKIAPTMPTSANKGAIIVRPTGYFLVIDDELVYIVDAGTAATLYPEMQNRDAEPTTTLATAALYQLNTNVATVYPVPQISDSFSDSSAPYLSDGRHVEGRREGQTATAEVSGALTSSTFDATYEINVPLNDTGDGGVFDGTGIVDIPGPTIEIAGFDPADEFVIIARFRVDAAATDTRVFTIGADGDNLILLRTVAGNIEYQYKAGGVTESTTTAYTANETYQAVFRLFDDSGTLKISYHLAGSKVGEHTIDGTWAGPIIEALSVVGALSTSINFAFIGEVDDFVVSIGATTSEADANTLSLNTTELNIANLDTTIGPGEHISYGLADRPIGASLGDGVSLLSGTWSSDGTTARSNAVVPVDKTTLATGIQIEFPRMQAAVTVDDTEEAGLIIRNHQIKVYRNDTTGDELRIYDIANTTQLSATTIIYSAGAELQAAYMRDGKIWCHYNGLFVIAQTVTVDPAELDVGLYADDLFGTSMTAYNAAALSYGGLLP